MTRFVIPEGVKRFATISVAMLLACGGAEKQAPPAAAPTSGASDGSEAEYPAGYHEARKCLAIAGAKREKKPNEPARVTVTHVRM